MLPCSFFNPRDVADVSSLKIFINHYIKFNFSFQNGPRKLSETMRKALSNDALAPVLSEPHFEALDRRVVIVLQEIQKCLMKSRIKEREVVN